MKIVSVPVADSTNSFIRALKPFPAENMIVYAVEQTAGRGQRGNSWESEPGKNLTFSCLYYPENLPAAEQFLLSCAISLAITDVLADMIPLSEGDVRIKWPNDIYVDDQKICGILIENSLCGKFIEWSILGVGINVNQKLFLSDAPNPVSLSIISGKEYDLGTLLDRFASRMESRLGELGNPEAKGHIMEEYISRLWRFNQWHTYELPDGERFTGRITAVAPDGTLAIEDRSGALRRFLFKEVKFIL